jgi:hypothetical protein
VVPVNSTIAENLATDKLGPAIGQLSKLKALVGIPMKGNLTTTANVTSGVIKNSTIQMQLQSKINNLVQVLKQQQ